MDPGDSKGKAQGQNLQPRPHQPCAAGRAHETPTPVDLPAGTPGPDRYPQPWKRQRPADFRQSRGKTARVRLTDPAPDKKSEKRRLRPRTSCGKSPLIPDGNAASDKHSRPKTIVLPTPGWPLQAPTRCCR